MYLQGVSADYHSYAGEYIQVDWSLRLDILQQMRCPIEQESLIAQRIYELDAKPWKSWLKPTLFCGCERDQFVDIHIHPDKIQQELQWTCEYEESGCAQGQFCPEALEEVGDYYLEGLRYSARRLVLGSMPPGYHKFGLKSKERSEAALLIAAPDSCYQPSPTLAAKVTKTSAQAATNYFGISCQLYSLRSEKNWGIGDFTDLKQLITLVAPYGVDLIGLNPLHAPLYRGPGYADGEFASPYSPSDRRFLNPLYLDLECEADFLNSEAKGYRDRPEIQQEILRLRETDLVDYDGVAAIKHQFLEMMFSYFDDEHLKKSSPRAQEFWGFVERGGQTLKQFSLFEAEQVAGSTSVHQNPVFHQYLQWLICCQLGDCQRLARDCGMPIGLKGDLAVGSVKEGTEVQSNKDLYAKSATIGAPPDPFSDTGQNWCLPAMDPVQLKASRYKHFIDLLRANMRHFGALRIDHVMALMRLWWCLGEQAKEGAYVYYQMAELFAILCLESHRNQCLIIGEDMGVVPPEFRAKMASTGVHGNRVLYFETDYDGHFKLPQNHQKDALLMVTNHDVPTLAGWWNGTDLSLRQQLNLTEDVSAERHQRESAKKKLIQWLQASELCPKAWQEDQGFSERPMDFDLCAAILNCCSRSESMFVLLQIEDLQLIESPVNIPGTHREYPNWRRKQNVNLSELFAQDRIQGLLRSLRAERQG